MCIISAEHKSAPARWPLLLLALAVFLPVLRGAPADDWKAELPKASGDRRLTLLINLTSSTASNAPEEALGYAEEAVTLAESLKDEESLGQAWLNVSLCRFYLAQPEPTRVAAERARVIFRKRGDRKNEASALLNLGSVAMLQNSWREAVARFEESLALLDAKAQPLEVANAYANLGGCWFYLGELDKAREQQRKALELRRAGGDQPGQAASLMTLGHVAMAQSDYPAASEHFLQSLRISEALGDLRNVAAAAAGLAVVLVDQRRVEDALPYLQQAIESSRQAQDRPRLALVLNQLSTVYQKQQRYPEARAAAEEAAAVARELGDLRLLGASLGNVGDTLMDEGKADESVKALQEAEQALEQANDATKLAHQRIRLAKALRLAGRLPEALRTIQSATQAAEERQVKRTLLAALDEQANIEEAAGDAVGALRDARRARTLDREMLDETTNKQIADAQTKYETEKKQHEIVILQRDRRIQDLALERQRIVRNSIGAGAGLLFVLCLTALNAYRIKRNAARTLAEKNLRLGEANEVITLERAKSDKLLLSILPASIAAQLKESTATIADSHPHATVLFADLVGFTVFAQTVPPEELVRLLDQIFTRFDRLAAHHGVEKIKTIGDCYMVVAGLPQPRADHCPTMAHMALEMEQELRAFNAEEHLNIQLRIGLHTGPVVAGVIGRQKFIYDLWGDTVNTASRMESSGVPGRIQITAAVATALGPEFACEPRGEIEVKGKGPLQTFFLLSSAVAA